MPHDNPAEDNAELLEQKWLSTEQQERTNDEKAPAQVQSFSRFDFSEEQQINPCLLFI